MKPGEIQTADGACPWWGFEFDWLAIDRFEHVASFSTGGDGPVPIAVVEQVATIDAYDTMHQLPVTGTCEAHNHELCGLCLDWDRLAQRGIFTYDWHLGADGAYGRRTVPSKPIVAAQLPRHLLRLARLAPLALDFLTARDVDLRGSGVVAVELDG